MPGWLQTAAYANPVTYLVGASRELLDTGVAGTDLLLSIGAALAVVAVFAPLAVRAYRRST